MAIIINLETTSDALREVYRKNGFSLQDCEIDQRLTKSDIRELLSSSRAESYYKELIRRIVFHPAADDEILDLILQDEDDASTQNTIATSGRASDKILRRLALSASKSVREHAELSLIISQLDRCDLSLFQRLIDEHATDEGIDLGVRMSVVNHPRTPIEVIQKLKDDDADFISDLAKKRLENIAKAYIADSP
jgi:hypothetical protein